MLKKKPVCSFQVFEAVKKGPAAWSRSEQLIDSRLNWIMDKVNSVLGTQFPDGLLSERFLDHGVELKRRLKPCIVLCFKFLLQIRELPKDYAKDFMKKGKSREAYSAMMHSCFLRKEEKRLEES